MTGVLTRKMSQCFPPCASHRLLGRLAQGASLHHWGGKGMAWTPCVTPSRGAVTATLPTKRQRKKMYKLLYTSVWIPLYPLLQHRAKKEAVATTANVVTTLTTPAPTPSFLYAYRYVMSVLLLTCATLLHWFGPVLIKG